MAVIIKYQLTFTELGLTVSNDLLSGDFILDVDIKAEMKRGASGSSFEIKLFDLPLDKAKEINKRADESVASLEIKLGYFDGSFETVMVGIIEKVSSEVADDKVVTTIKGSESGTYALQNNRIELRLDYNISVSDAVGKVLKTGPITRGEISNTPQIQGITEPLGHTTFPGEQTLMQVLDALAATVHAEFFVTDKKVWMGKPIRNQGYTPDPFDPDLNLAVFTPVHQNTLRGCDPRAGGENGDGESENSTTDLLRPIKAPAASGFNFTIAGDPKLRLGQKVKANIDDFTTDEFLVHSVTHRFTTTTGYICEGGAIKACTGGDCRCREEAMFSSGAGAAAGGIKRMAEAESRNRPAISIGKIKKYSAGEASGAEKHRGALYFGQRFDRIETQPSIHVAVDSSESRVFQNKPIISPFAWHKCGQIVPVYEGMKAALARNSNLQDDVLVTGFIWSETPAIEPPANKIGDWWLCLPIDFDVTQPPTDSTKAVNDLIANNGRRVIQVKGLKITIGDSNLANVGERPSEGADSEFLIEHKSGTKFKIGDDGKLTIEAQNIAFKGDVTIEGNVEIK